MIVFKCDLERKMTTAADQIEMHKEGIEFSGCGNYQ